MQEQRAAQKVCRVCIQAPTNLFNLSYATPTSISTNHTLDTIPLTYTLGKAGHKTKHPFCPVMAAQPPLPNAANLQAAVNGMTTEGNIIAQGVQAYNAHQQALNTELSLCANYNVAQIHQQLTAIQANTAAIQASVAAIQTSVDTINAR